MFSSAMMDMVREKRRVAQVEAGDMRYMVAILPDIQVLLVFWWFDD